MRSHGSRPTGTVEVARPPRAPSRLPGGELLVEPPPEPERDRARPGVLARLLPAVMLLGSVGFIAVLGPRNPTSWLFGGMFAISTLGMVLTGAGGRGGGNRAAGIDEDRRDYLRYLAPAAAPGAADRRRAARRARDGCTRSRRPGPRCSPRAGCGSAGRPTPTSAQLRIGLRRPVAGHPAGRRRRPGRSRASNRSRRSRCAGSCAGTPWCPTCRSRCRCGPARRCGSNRPARMPARRARALARAARRAVRAAAQPGRRAARGRRPAGAGARVGLGQVAAARRTPGAARRRRPAPHGRRRRRRACAAGGRPSSPGALPGPGRPSRTCWSSSTAWLTGRARGPGVAGVTVLRVGRPAGAAAGSGGGPAAGRPGPAAPRRRDATSRRSGSGVRTRRRGRGRGLCAAAGPLPARPVPSRRRDGRPGSALGLPALLELAPGPAGIAALRARWSRAAVRPAAGPDRASTSAARPVTLDLKESAQGGSGPHGLCVGATGSGQERAAAHPGARAGRHALVRSSSTWCSSTSRAAPRSSDFAGLAARLRGDHQPGRRAGAGRPDGRRAGRRDHTAGRSCCGRRATWPGSPTTPRPGGPAPSCRRCPRCWWWSTSSPSCSPSARS